MNLEKRFTGKIIDWYSGAGIGHYIFKYEDKNGKIDHGFLSLSAKLGVDFKITKSFFITSELSAYGLIDPEHNGHQFNIKIGPVLFLNLK